MFDHPGIERRPTPRLGTTEVGVYATQRIPAGTRVAAYDGPRIEYQGNGTLTPDQIRYCISVSETEIRDSTGLARYFNHSCDPNCRWEYDEAGDIHYLVTRRDILVDEELTWDYATAEKQAYVHVCGCGTSRCRGTDGGFLRLPSEILAEYLAEDGVLEWLRVILPLPK